MKLSLTPRLATALAILDVHVCERISRVVDERERRGWRYATLVGDGPPPVATAADTYYDDDEPTVRAPAVRVRVATEVSS